MSFIFVLHVVSLVLLLSALPKLFISIPSLSSKTRNYPYSLTSCHLQESVITGETNSNTMSILLETTFGDLVIDLDIDGSPALCKNVLKLVKARYYTNTLVYNVVPGKYSQMGGRYLILCLYLYVMYVLCI